VKYWAPILCLILLMCQNISATENESPFSDKQELYDHFDDPRLFKAMFFKAWDISKWLSDECGSGEDKCQAALVIMNQPLSQWNNLNAESSFSTVINCRELIAVTHPNPALKRILGKQIINSLRDIHGKLWLLSLCDGLKRNPNGIWNSQFSSWCMSITGINEVWIINYLIQVPGTDYQILSHLPYNPDSMKELKAKVDELNNLSEKWSLEWLSEN